MDIIAEHRLTKLKKKNRGNNSLALAIDKLIKDIKDNNWKNQAEMQTTRIDADCVSEGFYFFNINIHRTLILVEL